MYLWSIPRKTFGHTLQSRLKRQCPHVPQHRISNRSDGCEATLEPLQLLDRKRTGPPHRRFSTAPPPSEECRRRWFWISYRAPTRRSLPRADAPTSKAFSAAVRSRSAPTGTRPLAPLNQSTRSRRPWMPSVWKGAGIWGRGPSGQRGKGVVVALGEWVEPLIHAAVAQVVSTGQPLRDLQTAVVFGSIARAVVRSAQMGQLRSLSEMS